MTDPLVPERGGAALHTVPDVTLEAFTPVESGWVRADLAPDLSYPGSPPVFRVSPMTGWAHLITEDGEDYLLAVDNYGQWDPELVNSSVFFSRRLFREAQTGSLVLSKPALLARSAE